MRSRGMTVTPSSCAASAVSVSAIPAPTQSSSALPEMFDEAARRPRCCCDLARWFGAQAFAGSNCRERLTQPDSGLKPIVARSRASIRRTSRSSAGSRGSRDESGNDGGVAGKDDSSTLRRVVSAEGTLTGDGLVQHHPEREQIRAHVRVTSGHLFRRRIRHRAGESGRELAAPPPSASERRARARSRRGAGRRRSRGPSPVRPV